MHISNKKAHTKSNKKVSTNSPDTVVSETAIVGDVDSSSHKKSSPISPKFFVVGGIVLLLIFVLSWFMLRNATGAKTVCGEDIVNSYNSLSVYALRDESGDLTVDIEGLRTLASDITSKDGYQDDPTCQTILLEIAIFTNDYNSAKNALTAIEEFSNKKQYAATTINNVGTVDEYKTYVNQIAPTSGEESQEPQGGE